jgi:murein L,D-transpeptidase YafK
MKLPVLIILLLAVAVLSISSTGSSGPKPKVYRDTIYRWKTKPAQASTGKPAVRPAVPKYKAPELAEEDRLIRITSIIKRFRVKKSEQKLYAYFADTFKVFRISLGASPVGHKIRQGDNKTPEGTYRISYKNPNSRGYKSLKISYPNEADLSNARRMGVNPGGDIFIHGLWWPQQDPATHWKDNWTRGCIALNNEQIEEIFEHTGVDTEITILP